MPPREVVEVVRPVRLEHIRLEQRVVRDAGEDFAAYVWSFAPDGPIIGDGKSFPTQTPLSEAISKDLKTRGFKFVGPTIVYAWMQAIGMVDDHAAHCFRRAGA